MKKRIRIILFIFLAAVLVVSVVKVAQTLQDYKLGQNEYSDAQSIAGINDPLPSAKPSDKPEPTPAEEKVDPDEASQDNEEADPEPGPYAEALKGTDLDALRAVNSEVIGWISIPDTVVSYPILQTTNDYFYLRYTWNRIKSSVGSIFMTYHASPDFSDFHTVIYGHKMRNGSMFGGLKDYADASYWADHPRVYIVNDTGVHIYDIFAAFEAGTDALYNSLEISDEESARDFIEYSLMNSVIETGIVPDEYDHIITLATCTGKDYSARWVVQAVLHE